MEMDEREKREQQERLARRKRMQEETRRKQRERERIIILAGVGVLAVIVIVLLALGLGLKNRNSKKGAAGSSQAVSTEDQRETRAPKTSDAESDSQAPETGETGEVPGSEGQSEAPQTESPVEPQTEAPQTEAPQTEAPPETPATEPAAQGPWDLASLDNTEYWFGYSDDNRDETGYPTDWLFYENRWGQFNVDWVQDRSQNIIYLTMDEGYPNDYTTTILDILAAKNVKVTFFLTKMFFDGPNSPAQIQRMISEGHTLGNHTVSHPNMPEVGIEAETEQIMTMHNLIRDTFQYEMKLFRFPEGAYSAQSLGLVDNLGYKSVFWSYAYDDYSGEHDVEESLQKAVNGLHPGAIYLLHANSATNTAFLERFIDEARARGYEFGVYPIEGDSTRLK